MSGETGSKQQLVFTDAEINAAVSIVNAMIAKCYRLDNDKMIDKMIEVYARLLDATGEAKLRLKYEHQIACKVIRELEP
jgi:hemerythrin-like domain-containing protein